jgi:hypothetical protein
MKAFFKTLSILLFLCSCTTGRKEIIISQIAILDKTEFAKLEMDTTLFREQLFLRNLIPLKIDLLNNSDSVLYLWTNSCSWQSNWIPDNKSISWIVECPKNIPVLVKLAPHEKQTRYGIVELPDSPTEKFKLGFVLIRKNEVLNDFDFIPILRGKIKSKTDMFWSNSIAPGQ